MVSRVIKEFIELINTDKYIESIYMNGGCYKLYLMLREFYPSVTPYVNKEMDHVITMKGDKYFDITGEVENNGFHLMTEQEKTKAKEWSFDKTMVLQISECQYCGEPLVV